MAAASSSFWGYLPPIFWMGDDETRPEVVVWVNDFGLRELHEGDAWRRPGWPNAAELLAERLRRGSVVAGARFERAGAARQAFAGARAGEIAKPRTRQ